MIECEPPREIDLAVYDPSQGLHGYEDALIANQRYWQSQVRKARDNVNPAMEDLSQFLSGQLDQCEAQWYDFCFNPSVDTRVGEYTRRLVLSTLACGLLIRQQWGPKSKDLAPQDARGYGIAETMFDLHTGTDQTKLPLETRVHTPSLGDKGEVSETWYKTGNLFVKQVRPAEPTSYLLDYLE